MDHPDNGSLIHAHNNGLDHGSDGRYALRLASKAGFTEELVRIEYGDDSFLSLLGYDSDLDLASLDVEDRICRITLREYDLILAVRRNASAFADLGEKGLWIE
jgi:hypothetical protein